MQSKVCDSCTLFREDLYELNEILKKQDYFAGDGQNLSREEEKFFL